MKLGKEQCIHGLIEHWDYRVLQSTDKREGVGALPESEGEREDVEKGIDLEDTQEEDSEVFESLSEKVPEQSHIGSQVWDCESGEGVRV